MKIWRARASAIGRRTGALLAIAARWVWAQVDFEEIAITGALVLLAAGFWNWWRPGSYLAPAAVLLFIYLPTRYRFVVTPPSDEPKKSGRTP